MLSSSRLPEEPREQDYGGDAEHEERDPEGPDGAPGPVTDRGHVQARGEDRGDERYREHDFVARGGAHPERPLPPPFSRGWLRRHASPSSSDRASRSVSRSVIASSLMRFSRRWSSATAAGSPPVTSGASRRRSSSRRFTSRRTSSGLTLPPIVVSPPGPPPWPRRTCGVLSCQRRVPSRSASALSSAIS